MRADNADRAVTVAGISSEHHRPRHALPLRPGQRGRQGLRGAGYLQGKQPGPELAARQDVAANVPCLPPAALRQDRTSFTEAGKSDRPAARHRRRTIPVDPRKTDRRQEFIEPGITDFQECQINLGRLITDQHHPGCELTAPDGAHQQLRVIA